MYTNGGKPPMPGSRPPPRPAPKPGSQTNGGPPPISPKPGSRATPPIPGNKPAARSPAREPSPTSEVEAPRRPSAQQMGGIAMPGMGAAISPGNLKPAKERGAPPAVPAKKAAPGPPPTKAKSYNQDKPKPVPTVVTAAKPRTPKANTLAPKESAAVAHTTEAKRKTPFANTDLRNAASAGRRAVHQPHLGKETKKKGEEELDTQFRATQAKGAVDDMVLLGDVSQKGIEKNLSERYFEDKIYTYIGPVLISVNPYKRMADVGPAVIKKYLGRQKHDVQPHVYAVADEMYRKLMEDNYSQCVIISGESGAGKTEASKLIMNHIAQCSGNGGEVDQVKNVILQSNPLLESFGNAKTLRNNNSSRFGKYMEINFDRSGRPSGGLITNFLLEKSRVVGQLEGERSFHIFYQLLKGATAEEKDYYGLYEPENFLYLARSNCYTVDGMDDKKEYADVLKAMSVMGIDADTQQAITRLLAAILHTGNITFMEAESGGGSVPTDMAFVDFVASLLSVDSELLNQKLTSRVMKSGMGSKGSVYDVPFSPIQADAARDALAKALYSRLFDWLIQKVNMAMRTSRSGGELSINVLDIYGFEIFEKNGFEQFCINYVNEKLQQIFIDLTIQSEQDDYIAEGIQWTPIKFFNNKVVCELIEARRPPGVLAVLDDVCKTMHREASGVDEKFIQKLSENVSHPHLITRPNNFTIKHYAGDVLYDCQGFVEKNKDVLFKDLVLCMQSTDQDFILDLFPEDVANDDRKAPSTYGHKIYTQSQELVKKLRMCMPHYVRCIKPNENKSAHDWDAARCAHQITYLGLLENVRVRRAGFAYRGEYKRFIDRYNLCHLSTRHWNSNDRRGCEQLMSALGIPDTEWRMGKTKMFIKSPETLFGLDDLRERTLNHYAGQIQRFYWRNDPAKRRILEEKQYWWDMMVYLFQDVNVDPALGKTIEWPEYQEHLTQEVSHVWMIFQNWRANKLINALSPHEQESMRQKIVSYDIFHERKPWPCAREYVGNYMSQDKYFADAAAYRLAEHTLLQKAGESVVIFSDVVTKINKYYKPKDVALMVTSEHFYKYDHKKYKQIKKPIPVASIKSVSLSPHEDTFVIVHMTPPERDLLLNLSVDGNNKVAEFVTMLQQIYTVLHGKALPVEFVQTVTLNLSRDAKKEGTPMNLTYQRDPEPHASGVSRFVALKKPNAAIYYTP